MEWSFQKLSLSEAKSDKSEQLGLGLGNQDRGPGGGGMCRLGRYGGRRCGEVYNYSGAYDL